jgi:hypothetical protein
MKTVEMYVAPEVEICDLLTEGVLNSSTGNEVVMEEEGLGAFN